MLTIITLLSDIFCDDKILIGFYIKKLSISNFAVNLQLHKNDIILKLSKKTLIVMHCTAEFSIIFFLLFLKKSFIDFFSG